MMFSLLPVSAAAVKWYDEHSVTVKYVFKDDSSKSKSDDVKKTIPGLIGKIITFKVEKAGYKHSAQVTSGKADCSIDDLGYLHVEHVDADSVITVTYTPKDNVITIDQYYNNGSIIPQWSGKNFKVNGPEIVENNKLDKGAIIDNKDLTAATEKYRFLTVGDKTYDFSYARQIPYPGASSSIKLTDVWYERDTGEWYYSHLGNTKVLLANKSGVNFCYNVQHTEASAHHQFDQPVKTVAPTCTEQGYTVYKCAYCTETEKREYTGPLGHQWGDWVHVDGTEKENSKHQRVCQRCNKKEDPENCNFAPVPTVQGTHTCTVCGYSYTDEITPTGTPVYVYFQTVDTAGNPIGDKDHENVKGVKHNENGSGWATLGKLTTKLEVNASTDKDALGAEVKDVTKFAKHPDNKDFDLDLISEWVGLTQNSGAAGYESEAPFGTYVWHLDGTVYGYRAIYCDSDGTELEGFTPNQTPEYYLKGATDIALTNEVPVVPGKVFDGWDTNDVTVENNTFTMPGKDVTFTAKWKPGALKIEKILDDNSPAAEKTFSFTVTPGVEPVQIKGKGSKTISDLPVGSYTVTEDSSTAAVSGYRCTTQYSINNIDWQDTPVTVSVASNDTMTVYVKNSYTPITADLIDDNIAIKHGVNGAPADDDDTDTTAHIVEKNAKISYQATLDMQSLEFGDNPEHADDVSSIQAMIGTGSLWEFMKGKNITMFAGSKVNLYVKFSDKLVNPAALDGIALESGWFKLDPANKPIHDDTTGYWTIPCVIKDATDAPDIDTNDSIVTLSRITLPLTAAAQGELSSDTELDIISGGYIDGTIKISVGPLAYTLKLEGMSKEAPAQNTAKLKLAVPTYTVTYDANGGSGKTTDNTAYATGAKATVKENNYTRGGYTFTGWNTKADGSGDSYKTGDWITMTGSVILYAQWTRNSSHGGDDDDKYFFAIQKVDAQDGHALNGAKFELYQLDKNDRIVNRRVVETTRQSSKSGIALFSVDNKKSYDGIWYYAEVSAPEGYVLDRTEYEINHKDFSDSLSTAVKYADTVRNYRGTTPDLLNDSDHFAYVIGYMDGNVRPYGLISRAETTTIFFRLLKDSVRDGNLLTSNTYTDVADDYWANTAISTMTGLGIVQGRSTTTFDPKAPITRAQFAAICARFDTGKSNGEQTFSDISGHWAEKYIQRAAELGWIKGFEDGTFRPDTYITRAQAMTMINRVLNRIPEDESDLLPGMNVWPDCNPGDWFYLAVQEATNSHDFEHKAGNYETWTKLMKNPDWTRYEN